MEVAVMWRFRKPSGVKVFLVVAALLYSLHSLKNCRTCISLPRTVEESIDSRKEEGNLDKYRATSSAAGFLSHSPLTIHTVKVEAADGDTTCHAACSIGLQHACGESGWRDCVAILRTAAKSSVAFEDLTGGDYTLTVHCEESETYCYAEPQVYTFHVEPLPANDDRPLKHIPLDNIKLFRRSTGQCSSEQVWRSRITCLGILYTFMGIVLLMISHTERLDDEQRVPSRIMHDIKWVLQSKSRTS